ncbi:MAG TPA: TIM44-like domain-containing protein [Trinickia sp.]|jgi:predicted lipid-binding transport protein (Tim44 family)|uniref:Tim44 domain-containing protein n=1 Tax=Trinickia sp. TaxID=2571163 RepID=UPI002C178088|nr:TIM44-like domain-containing protein [Trinickia sp.]HTI17936.1 TIM44-like domain-containing protein [Trinickia sp.]
MSDSLAVPCNKLSSSLVKRIGQAAIVVLIAASAVASLDADAKRLGGGRSMGRQAQTTQSAPATPPAQQPMQQSVQPSPSQAARGQAAPAPAAASRSRWLGPIAGLAAGLGIAALLSHFGLGEAFAAMLANAIIIALVAFAVIWLVRKLTSRGRRDTTPAYGAAGAGTATSMSGTRFDSTSFNSPPFGNNRTQAGGYATREGGASSSAQVGSSQALPANFDAEAFLHHAKLNFARLQQSWDDGNLAELRELTTPDMFALLKADIDARAGQANRTDIVQLHADMLGLEDRGTEYLASVRFTGLLRETVGGSAEPFSEVWNLSKAARPGEGWLLAGIEQGEVTHH